MEDDEGIPDEWPLEAWNHVPLHFYVSSDDEPAAEAVRVAASPVLIEDTPLGNTSVNRVLQARETVTIEDTQPLFLQNSSPGEDYFPAGQEWMWRVNSDDESSVRPGKKPAEEPDAVPAETSVDKPFEEPVDVPFWKAFAKPFVQPLRVPIEDPVRNDPSEVETVSRCGLTTLPKSRPEAVGDGIWPQRLVDNPASSHPEADPEAVEDGIWPRGRPLIHTSSHPEANPEEVPEAVPETGGEGIRQQRHVTFSASGHEFEAVGGGMWPAEHLSIPSIRPSIIPEFPVAVAEERCVRVNIPGPTYFVRRGRQMYDRPEEESITESEGITARVLFPETQRETSREALSDSCYNAARSSPPVKYGYPPTF